MQQWRRLHMRKIFSVEFLQTRLRLRRGSAIFSLVSPRKSKNHPVNKY